MQDVCLNMRCNVAAAAPTDLYDELFRSRCALRIQYGRSSPMHFVPRPEFTTFWIKPIRQFDTDAMDVVKNYRSALTSDKFELHNASRKCRSAVSFLLYTELEYLHSSGMPRG
jgi:hypothetical protein